MMMTQMNFKIWLVRHRVDFRKQHQGLLAEAYKMQLNPYQGDVLIFVGKGLRKIKVLYADKNGLWLSTKIFSCESMKTKFKFLSDPFCDVISSSELSLIIDGSRYSIEKTVKNYP